MYVDIEIIAQLAKIITALGTISAVGVTLYKFIERDKKQSAKIEGIQKEQTLICYGIVACLRGLSEQGCDGPVSEALDKLEKHLNLAAHDQEGA